MNAIIQFMMRSSKQGVDGMQKKELWIAGVLPEAYRAYYRILQGYDDRAAREEKRKQIEADGALRLDAEHVPMKKNVHLKKQTRRSYSESARVLTIASQTEYADNYMQPKNPSVSPKIMAGRTSEV